MVLLAETLSTLSWAALILSVSLCLCMSGRERRWEEERKFLFRSTVSDRSEGLCTIHLRGVNQQVGAKAGLASLRILLALWQVHKSVSCVLEKKKKKRPKETSHLSFDKIMDQIKMFRVSSTTGYVVMHLKKSIKWLHCHRHSYVLNFVLNA